MTDDKFVEALRGGFAIRMAEAIRDEIDSRIQAHEAKHHSAALSDEQIGRLKANLEATTEATLHGAQIAAPKPVPREHCGRRATCSAPFYHGRYPCIPSACGREHEPGGLRRPSLTHCAGCGAPYEISGDDASKPAHEVGAMAGQAPEEAGASTVDSDEMRLAKQLIGNSATPTRLESVAGFIHDLVAKREAVVWERAEIAIGYPTRHIDGSGEYMRGYADARRETREQLRQAAAKEGSR